MVFGDVMVVAVLVDKKWLEKINHFIAKFVGMTFVLHVYADSLTGHVSFA